MKQPKPTPLFIGSIGLILYGFYLLFFKNPGEEGWGALSALIISLSGAMGWVIYAVLREVFQKKIWVQVGIETIFIIGLLYIGYRKNNAFEFHLPYNYRGYVMLVYGVDNAPTLAAPFYSNKIKLNVTSSGIVVTSSLPDDNSYSPALFLDSTLGDIHDLPKPYTRYDIPHAPETLKCNDRNYRVDIWLIKEEPNWMKEEDTLNHLGQKLIEACTMIR